MQNIYENVPKVIISTDGTNTNGTGTMQNQLSEILEDDRETDLDKEQSKMHGSNYINQGTVESFTVNQLGGGTNFSQTFYQQVNLKAIGAGLRDSEQNESFGMQKPTLKKEKMIKKDIAEKLLTKKYKK